MFLVDAQDQKGEISLHIMSSLLNRGVRILSQNARVNEMTGELVLHLVCDLRDSYFTPDDLLIHLRSIRNVNHATGVSLKNKMFGGLLFPVTMMETERVVAVDSNLTFHILEKLGTEHAKSIFVESASHYGKHIVESIRQKLEEGTGTETSPRASIEAVQDNVRSYMMASGWGRINWQSEDKADRVLIHDPPTVSRGASAEGNLFLRGMFAGILEAIWNKEFSFSEEQYDPKERLLTLAYASPAEVIQKEKVLAEIEKIIESVEAKADEGSQAKQLEAASQVTALVPIANSGLTLLTLMRSGDGFGAEQKRSAEYELKPRVNKREPTKIEERVGKENALASVVEREKTKDLVVGPYSVLKPALEKEIWSKETSAKEPSKNHRGSARRKPRKPLSKYPPATGKKFAELEEGTAL